MIDVEEQKVFCSYEGRINRRAGKRGCPQLALRTFARFLRRVPFGFAAFARTGALEDDVIHLEAALNLFRRLSGGCFYGVVSSFDEHSELQ